MLKCYNHLQQKYFLFFLPFIKPHLINFFIRRQVYKHSFRILKMVLRIVNAHGLKPGNIFLFENEPYTVKSNDISKTGKHGASKCRIMTYGVFSGKKKIIAVPGDERFDVPNVEKKRVQVLSVGESTASVMDLESYETIDVPYDEELKGQLQAEQQAEIWDIEGKKVIMRIV